MTTMNENFNTFSLSRTVDFIYFIVFTEEHALSHFGV